MAFLVHATYQLKDGYNSAYSCIFHQAGVDVICKIHYTNSYNEEIFEDLIMDNITSVYTNGKLKVNLKNDLYDVSFWDNVTNIYVINISNLQLQYMEYIFGLGSAKLYNTTFTLYKEINHTTLLYDTIPYNHDCVNHSNIIANDNHYNLNPTTRGIFDKNGDVGGNGKNIDLTFTAISKENNESSTGYEIDGTFDNDVNNRTCWQRDEIYRMSIQFMNNLGRKSHPKWMLDCRMPDHNDEDYGNYVWQDGSNIINYSFLYPQFQVNNLPKNEDGSYMKWRILYTKRELKDKTVLGTALIAPTVLGNVWEDGGVTLPYVNYCAPSLPSVNSLNGAYHIDMMYNDVPLYQAGVYPIDKKLLEIISPDIQFNNLDLSSAIVQVVGTLDNSNNYFYREGASDLTSFINWFEGYHHGFSVSKNHLQRVKKLSRFFKLDTPLSQLRTNIEKSKIINPKPFNISSYNIKGKEYKHICHKKEDALYRSSHGTCAIAKVDDEIELTGDDELTSYLFATIKKDTIPYGGNSYVARFNNKYIPASEFYDNVSIHNAEKGDTYIGMFDYMRSQYNKSEVEDDIKSLQEIIYIPCETQINLSLRNDDSFSKIANSDLKVNYKLKEDGLVDVDSGTEITKLYQYNSVYSRQNDIELYTPLPYDSSEDYLYDSRIRRSDIKYNSEYSDSWLKFLQNNYIDVDSQYGKLTKLDVHKNRLLFFQEKGFGIIPVGEKELLLAKDTTTLALGTGGILNRFDYISDSIGVTHKKALISTPNALYIYSNILNTLYRYDQNLTSLTDSLGMNSWFDNYIDSSNQALFGYNPVMSELLFQFPMINGNVEILVYNEMTNSFVYFYPYEFADNYKFTEFITMNKSLYSFSDATNNYRAYKHNYSNYRNTIHGQYGKSSLDIIVAPQQGNIVTFNVLEFLTKITEGDTDISATANNIKITNDYQDSGNIIINTTGNDINIKKRFRTWRFSKIRDDVVKKPRIKSEYIKIHLDFDYLQQRKLIIKNITTNYSVSNIIY